MWLVSTNVIFIKSSGAGAAEALDRFNEIGGVADGATIARQA